MLLEVPGAAPAGPSRKVRALGSEEREAMGSGVDFVMSRGKTSVCSTKIGTV
jgi:hypothetical protein